MTKNQYERLKRTLCSLRDAKLITEEEFNEELKGLDEEYEETTQNQPTEL